MPERLMDQQVVIPDLNAWRWRAEDLIGQLTNHDHSFNSVTHKVPRFFDSIAGNIKYAVLDPKSMPGRNIESPYLRQYFDGLIEFSGRLSGIFSFTGGVKILDPEAFVEKLDGLKSFGNTDRYSVDDRQMPKFKNLLKFALDNTLDGTIWRNPNDDVLQLVGPAIPPTTPISFNGLVEQSASVNESERRQQVSEFIAGLRRSPLWDIPMRLNELDQHLAVDYSNLS